MSQCGGGRPPPNVITTISAIPAGLPQIRSGGGEGGVKSLSSTQAPARSLGLSATDRFHVPINIYKSQLLKNKTFSTSWGSQPGS